MIDWWGVIHNSLWVTGLALALAVLSMVHYEARVDRVRLRKKLSERRFQLPFTVGMVLLCLGLLLSSRQWWQIIIWGLLTALSAGRALWLCKLGCTETVGPDQSRRKDHEQKDP
ncbi:MAG TPA: hypothetical protein VLY63_15750 [Anaerolineae bacterium]|nr:hypothetical protein [Anaerolineae bacterium]